jgi:hypothetical protein
MSLAGLVEVIHWLEDVFERVGLRRSYGGAIAYNYYGPPRVTQDVDLLVLGRTRNCPNSSRSSTPRDASTVTPHRNPSTCE